MISGTSLTIPASHHGQALRQQQNAQSRENRQQPEEQNRALISGPANTSQTTEQFTPQRVRPVFNTNASQQNLPRTGQQAINAYNNTRNAGGAELVGRLDVVV
jgi:hypothetical protein